MEVVWSGGVCVVLHVRSRVEMSLSFHHGPGILIIVGVFFFAPGQHEQTHLPRKYTWAVLKRQTKSVMEGSTGHIEETNRDEEETTRDKREQRKGKKQWNFAHT